VRHLPSFLQRRTPQSASCLRSTAPPRRAAADQSRFVSGARDRSPSAISGRLRPTANRHFMLAHKIRRRQHEHLAHHVRILLVSAHEPDHVSTSRVLDHSFKTFAHQLLKRHPLVDHRRPTSTVKQRLLDPRPPRIRREVRTPWARVTAPGFVRRLGCVGPSAPSVDSRCLAVRIRRRDGRGVDVARRLEPASAGRARVRWMGLVGRSSRFRRRPCRRARRSRMCLSAGCPGRWWLCARNRGSDRGSG
jgi:hypothetical protein